MYVLAELKMSHACSRAKECFRVFVSKCHFKRRSGNPLPQYRWTDAGGEGQERAAAVVSEKSKTSRQQGPL